MADATVLKVSKSDVLGSAQEFGGDAADIRAVEVYRVRFTASAQSVPIYKGGLGLCGIYWPAQAGGETLSVKAGPKSTLLETVANWTDIDMTNAGHQGYSELAEAPWMQLVPSGAITGDIYLMFT